LEVATSGFFLASSDLAAVGVSFFYNFFESLIGVDGAGVPFSTVGFLVSPSLTGSGFGGRALIGFVSSFGFF